MKFNMIQKMKYQHTTELTTDTTEVASSGNTTRISSEIDTVLLKIASRCNINCSYCYVYQMGDDNWSRLEKLISEETIQATCSQLRSLADHQDRKFSLVLHGGEPLLLGSKRLDSLFKKLRRELNEDYPISIQTNGVLLNQEILNICSEYRVSVAVSIDGPEEVNDASRIGHTGKGTFKEVLKGIDTLKSHPDSEFLFAGLLAVIDPSSDPLDVYQFFKEIGTPSVDFLYKDGNHSRLPQGKSKVDSVEYGRWMSSILKIYLQDPDPIEIRVRYQ